MKYLTKILNTNPETKLQSRPDTGFIHYFHSMKYLFTVLILIQLVPGMTIAQWTPFQCEEFVIIYFETEKQFHHPEESIEILLDKYKVSHIRFKEMLNLDKGSRDQSGFSNNEHELIAALSRMNQELKASRDLVIQEACRDSPLSYRDFVAMRTRYKTEIAFQRFLKPYFDDYIKAQK